eukprot:PhF_6_TR37446/c2_g1_i9/m.55047
MLPQVRDYLWRTLAEVNLSLILLRFTICIIVCVLMSIHGPVHIVSELVTSSSSPNTSPHRLPSIIYHETTYPMALMDADFRLVNNDVLEVECVLGRTILFAGHCVARTMADNLRWNLDRTAKPNLNPRGHHVWVHNKTNTRIDHVFLHSSDMPESRLKSIKAVPYTDVVLTAGLWEMFSMDDVGTAYKEMVRYMTVIRDTFPTSRFIVMNNYHLAQARAVATMRHVCTTPDRQAAYRDIIACAASEVFESSGNRKYQYQYQYYDPYSLTLDEAYVAKYRSPDGIHYDRLSPVGMELGRGILRGLCKGGVDGGTPHPQDRAVCPTRSLSELVSRHDGMRCHIACQCSPNSNRMLHFMMSEFYHPGRQEITSYCRRFHIESNKKLSMRTCYTRGASDATILQDYFSVLSKCRRTSKHSREVCYDHESIKDFDASSLNDRFK